MDHANTIIGICIVVLALSAMTALVLRSRQVIDRLADSKPASIRDAMRELKNGGDKE